MKGIILAAGQGNDLKPLTNHLPKPMIKILDKPLIQFAVDRLTHCGIQEIIIVIPKDDVLITSYFQQTPQNSHIEFVNQSGKGIDGAIKSVSKIFNEDDQFLLTHSDIVTADHITTRTLNAAHNSGADMAIAVSLEREVQDFGMVSIDSDGYVDEILSPNETDKSNYIVAGTFLLNGKIFNYLNQGISFNDCFNHFISDGGKIVAGIWNDTWIDVGRPWDVLRASYFMLKKLKVSYISSNVEIGPNVEINGPVIIEDGVKILNGTIINGPVHIGENAFIGNNTLIRDNTSIQDNAKIGMGVEIRSSIIMSNASIARLSYIGASIIADNVTIHSGVITIVNNSPPSEIHASLSDGSSHIVPLNKFGAVIGSNSHIGVHTSLKPGTIINSNSIIEPNQVCNGWVE